MKCYIKELCFSCVFAIFLSFSILLLQPSIIVHAEETIIESSTDTEQNERLNNLEVRLEEMGFRINEIELSLESLHENQALEEEQRLAITQQLELLIVGMNDLCNYNIELLDKLDTKELTDTAYQNLITTALEVNELAMMDLNQTMLLQSEATVSGNALLDTTLKEGQTADTESKEVFLVVLLIGFGLVIGVASAIVLMKGFNRHV